MEDITISIELLAAILEGNRKFYLNENNEVANINDIESEWLNGGLPCIVCGNYKEPHEEGCILINEGRK